MNLEEYYALFVCDRCKGPGHWIDGHVCWCYKCWEKTVKFAVIRLRKLRRGDCRGKV